MLIGQRRSAGLPRDNYDVDSEASNHLQQHTKMQRKSRHLMKHVMRRQVQKGTSGSRGKSSKSCTDSTAAIRTLATSTTARCKRCSNVPEPIERFNSWRWNLNVPRVASMSDTNLIELRLAIFLLNQAKLCQRTASTGTIPGTA